MALDIVCLVRGGSTAAVMAATVLGCSDPPDLKEYGRTVSPNASIEASVVEFRGDRESDSNTQVLLSFDGGKCGSGAVSLKGVDLGVTLKWHGNDTLEVGIPQGRDFERNASGESIRCFDKTVRVAVDLVPSNPSLERP